MGCGRRFGKTWASAMEATYVASQPDKRVWLVGMSYRKARLIFREVWKRMVIGHGEDIERASEKDMFIHFKWGTSVEAMSADNPSSLVGEGLDLLVIDEAAKMPKKVWDMYLAPTVAGRKGKVIFITTPEGYNWIHDLYLLGQKDFEWESHQAPSWINQHEFPKGELDPAILERKRNSSPEYFLQEFGAHFTSFEGKVYSFNRLKDVQKIKYNPNYPTYCSIDFGFRMPAVIWAQTYSMNGVEHINVIDEILHEKDIPTDVLAKKILLKGYPIQAYFGDPSGSYVQGQTGLGDTEIFRRHGSQVQFVRDRASRNVASGVSYVRGFFESADEERTVHVSDKCVGIMEDFEGYRYPEAREGKNLNDEPIKDGYHDHGCDAWRYFIVNRFPMKNRQMKRIKR